jgi:hypothetical protein
VGSWQCWDGATHPTVGLQNHGRTSTPRPGSFRTALFPMLARLVSPVRPIVADCSSLPVYNGVAEVMRVVFVNYEFGAQIAHYTYVRS